MRKVVSVITVVLFLLLAAEVGFLFYLNHSGHGAPSLFNPTTESAPPTTEDPTVITTQAPTTEPPTEAPTEAPTEPQPETFLLTFVGDCTLGCNRDKVNVGLGFLKTVGDNYDYPFANVRGYFENDDFTFVNLEGALTNGGTPYNKAHVFRGYPEYTQILTGSSVEAVSLANNHSRDYGEVGYQDTKTALENAGVLYVEQDNTLICTTERGLTIGIYAVTYEHVDKEEIYANIAALAGDETIDLVIFAPHWGTENSYRANPTQTELSRGAIDAGAHIVYTSHAHVLQPIEEYNGGIIYYSLGNFCFGGMINLKDFDTALLQQEVIREPDGTVHLGRLLRIPCSVGSDPSSRVNDYQPTPYAEGSKEYDRVLSKLDGSYTGADIPIG